MWITTDTSLHKLLFLFYDIISKVSTANTVLKIVRGTPNNDVKKKLYIHMACPHLEYASARYGPRTKNTWKTW